jgi:hypothetical protein
MFEVELALVDINAAMVEDSTIYDSKIFSCT